MHSLFGIPALEIPAVFFVVSFVFSMLGMGGSQLYIPILYWFGMNFKHEAIPLGLLLNIVTSTSASYTYYRSGLIKFRIALPFALAMVLFAPVGAYLDLRVRVGWVILVFAIFTFVSAFIALTGWSPKVGARGGRAEILWAALAGCLLGILVGFTGRGGGAFVVPVLLMLGFEPKSAAATSSFIITLAAVSGLVGHLPKAHFYPAITLGCVVSVLLGSQLGSRFMVKRLDSRKVRYIFALLLLGVAALLLRDAVFLLRK